MHFRGSSTMAWVESSLGRSGTRLGSGIARTAYSAARVCNSQVPLRPQVKHSFGCFERIISIVVLRTSTSSGSRW